MQRCLPSESHHLLTNSKQTILCQKTLSPNFLLSTDWLVCFSPKKLTKHLTISSTGQPAMLSGMANVIKTNADFI